MATTVLTFNLSGTAQSTSEQVFGVQVDPSANIRGKLCYVECTYFVWDNGTTITPAINSRDAFYLTCNWSQPMSGMNTNGKTLPSAALAAFQNNFSYSSGPVLCRVPDGPHELAFSIKRVDGGKVNEDTTATNYALIFLKIVPADSRQPPIGV
jgi:hypothetical protein